MEPSSKQLLVPIETPLITTGLYPETLAKFGKFFSSYGMAAMAGGTAAPSPDDSKLKPGDMVGFDLVRGDLSISSGCTVTMVQGDRILACGHPLFGFGKVEMPLSRAHVMMTLASAAAFHENYHHGRYDWNAHGGPPNRGDGHLGTGATNDSA